MTEVGGAPLSLSQAVLGQLRRLDLLLCERAKALQAQRADASQDLRGLFISDGEFEELLQRPFGQALLDAPPRPAPLPGALSAPEAWEHFLQRFGLSSFEGDLLLLGLLPEVDLKYERIYAFLQDDVTCRRPTCDLVLALLCDGLPERLRRRQSFEPEAPLRRQRLIDLQPREGHGGLLAAAIVIPPRVASHLLGQTDFPPSSASPISFAPTHEALAPLSGDLAVTGRAVVQVSERMWVFLSSADWRTAQRVARQMAQSVGWPLDELDLAAADPSSLSSAAADAVREALLHDAALLVHVPPPREGDEWEPGALSAIRAAPLEALERAAFFAGERLDERLPTPPEGWRVLRLSLPLPDYAQRAAIWRRALGAASVEPGAVEAVAGRFRLSTAQIEQAAAIARDAAWQRDPDASPVHFDDLASAARLVSSGSLGRLAKHVEARHAWDDLVLPSDRIAQLRELCDQFIYRPLVYDTWGFGKRSSLGTGLSALFAGPSGTGKTMAAEVIAGELALDLYKIDLSGVVSKYIGETEKNLERIFEMARDSNAILLFDEADALFGKRSETKDAHDRYANIEISYLLQKIEEYDGVVILTSNLRQNLDEAFLRRLQFTIEFPMPDEEARLAIWRRTLPQAAPRQSDIDLEEMARRYRFSGGSIRNVLVNAAFLAARDGQVLGMEHLLWAARREFQKLGKLVDEAQFVREPGRAPSWLGEANHGAR